MPTGYTHPIEDGEITELPDFILRCSRGMAVNISMRDLPLSVEPPRQYESHTEADGLSSYERQSLEEANRELERLQGMTIEEAAILAEEQHIEAWASYDKRKREYDQERELWDDWADRIDAWDAPEVLASLKSFMLDQIRTSSPYPPAQPSAKMTGEEYISFWVQRHQRTIEMRDEDVERRQRNGAEGQAWLDAMWAEVDRMREEADAGS